ncbi:MULTISPECIES: 23S rRNA (pseudouridine(1915)-N(3))-methyltransferase RlmH [unclassified Enterococcus]|uniref:23S rRNA (pseudouridine(1915)-N(3))-methyltransferase RlmH n=1 Tax=unclassified Enterococcus TaxID=2608891 RepID=UPI0015563D59|nr:MULTISPECIES: 23S rRNA (pseudouridine(1915)-N(3))-methyltransferase RlmH [unclassified Enterococcus]MBS7577505.1 23S rRNA (pseudouridine(1915)-N(3))-methyltransferase RlmH [Enterococcus sp. MMGLQ5-2]MBS7584996.1 23S rRNA (pseudouridine(1915)-N(3))-methyltransferase RlmH [Enterococcus sp. MMGLQ5-1]NPD12851.1 23S rRNA (pseudouridine(1915)-N(3))-methyltransferase RlmH [Enterococcus sp. MMGLQ5-1]NPD37338.1 23S rRNA (pseudouridine(1915)-N(3))-methyltransferase RlmH [Enterococcus sp. MMGLQ5-2]
MNIKIITVGKLKENYLKEGISEYQKRLTKFAKIQIIEVADEKAPERLSDTEMRIVKEKEGQRILEKIKDKEYMYALAIQAKERTSENLAEELRQLTISGKSDLTFVIGGSLGLSEEVLSRANQTISFGKMTYPHQLMRLILIEQIYRSQTIIAGMPYHK